MFRVLVYIFAVSVLAFARGNDDDSWEEGELPPPLILDKVTAEGLDEFTTIVSNVNSTKAQIQDAIAAWSTKYNVSEVVTAFEVKKKANYASHKVNVINAISELSAAFSAISMIKEDASITEDQEGEQIRALTDNYSDELVSFIYATRPGGCYEAWATKFNISDAVTAVDIEKKANYAEHKAKVIAAISELSAAFSAISTIKEDTSITKDQEREQIRALIDAYSDELVSLLSATRPGGCFGFGGLDDSDEFEER